MSLALEQCEGKCCLPEQESNLGYLKVPSLLQPRLCLLCIIFGKADRETDPHQDRALAHCQWQPP